MKARKNTARRAFTLVEMLAAITIFSLIAVMIFTIISNTANITSSTTARLDTTRVARECFDLIGNDLRVLPPPYNNRIAYTLNPSLDLTKTSSIQMLLNNPGTGSTPSGIENYSYPHSIFWQAPLARNKNYGNLAVVGYYLLRDLQANPKNTRLQLRRLYVEPEVPADPPPASANYLIYDQANAWCPSALLKKFAPDTLAEDNSNGQKGWVADGVLAMWIRCLDSRGQPIVTKADGAAITPPYSYNSRDSYRYSDTSLSPAAIRYPESQSAALPSYIEVALVCIAPKDMVRITSLPTASATNPANFYDEVEIFTKGARSMNPGVKSIESFYRKFRIYSTSSS